MTDPSYLVCPACERAERATERVSCPDCGSDRTYLSHAPALPDATSEGYVKLSAETVEDATADAERPEEPRENDDGSGSGDDRKRADGSS